MWYFTTSITSNRRSSKAKESRGTPMNKVSHSADVARLCAFARALRMRELPPSSRDCDWQHCCRNPRRYTIVHAYVIAFAARNCGVEATCCCCREPQDCEGDVENDRGEQRCPEESKFSYSSGDAKTLQVSRVDSKSRVHFHEAKNHRSRRVTSEGDGATKKQQ